MAKRIPTVKIIYLIPFAIFLLLALAKKFNKRYKITKQIPMIKNKRSLNLATSAAIIISESLRQTIF